jgi:hypothetical protein
MTVGQIGLHRAYWFGSTTRIHPIKIVRIELNLRYFKSCPLIANPAAADTHRFSLDWVLWDPSMLDRAARAGNEPSRARLGSARCLNELGSARLASHILVLFVALFGELTLYKFEI